MHKRTEDGGAKLHPLGDVRYGPNQVRWALRRIDTLEEQVALLSDRLLRLESLENRRRKSEQ